MECPICLGTDVLVSPPDEYCDHELCMSCWINIGMRNPLCPVCRYDLTMWMKNLGVEVNSKERFEYEDLSEVSEVSSENGTTDYSNIPLSFGYVSHWNGDGLRFGITDTIGDFISDEEVDTDSEEIDYPEEPELRNPSGNDHYYTRYDLELAPMSDFNLRTNREPGHIVSTLLQHY